MSGRLQRGAGVGKYLLLLVFLGLFVGWYMWKQNYGAIGQVSRLSGTTKDQIAFLRTDAGGACNLYLIGADGTGLKQLTSDDHAKRLPAWSPDGTRLAYVQEARSGGSSTYQLFIMGDGAPRQASYGTISKDMPQWKPDGKLIAFLAGGAIKVVSPNAAKMRQIYPPPHRGDEQEHEGDGDAAADTASGLRRPPITYYRWSPTGSALVGVQVLEGENAAALGVQSWWSSPKLSDADEAPQGVVEPESIVVLPHLEAEPFTLPGAERVMFTWFPDGRQVLAMIATRQGRCALVRCRTDEKNLPIEPVVSAEARTIAFEAPALSPDGRAVAVELWRSEAGGDRTLQGIGVIPVDAAAPMRIRSLRDADRLKIVIKGDARTPQWSRDGSRLLYSRVRPDGRADICVADKDGRNERNLTNGKGDNYDATWSPSVQ